MVNTRQIATFLLATLVFMDAGYGMDSARFRHLNVEDGLSQDTVQAIAQDHDGFLWLGTQHGLNRFDGFTFRTYYSGSTGESALPADWVWSLLVDHRGRLWLGTEGGGLAYREPESDRFIHVAHHPEQPADSLSGFGVRALAEDRSGNIWIGSDGGGITRLDPDTGSFTNFQKIGEEAHGLPSDHIKALHVDAAGRIWVGTDDRGLYQFNQHQEKFQHLPLPPGSEHLRIRSIVSSSDLLWVGTTENGLYRLDLRTRETTHYQADGSAGAISSNSIRALLIDQEGTLWVGHDSTGVDRLLADGSFESLRATPTDPHGLSDDHVSALFQDAGKLVWIGTMKGTSRWNPASGVFANYNRTSTQMPVTENWISSFADNGDGTYWVGTAGGGVNRMHFGSGEVSVLRNDPQQLNSLSDDRVFSLARAGEALWVGTRAHGLNRFDLNDGTWQRFRHDPRDSTTLSNDGVTSILRHSDGSLWVGTYLGGLNRFHPETNTFSHFRQDQTTPNSLCFDRVLSLTEGGQGLIWVGTHGGGLCSLDPATNAFTTYRHDADDPHSLSSDTAWLTTEDHSGNLWVGTADAGINVWLAKDRARGIAHFHRFSTAHGLPSSVVYGLVTDMTGNVWMSSNRGLARLTLDAQSHQISVRLLRKVDGLQGSEFNFAAALVGSDGRLMFGGTDGFTMFYPEALTSRTYDAPLSLTSVLGADGRDIPLSPDRSLTLTHQESVVTFEYAAMDFASPESVTYERMLEGFDDDWIRDGNRHRTSYTNLSAGDYVFRVRTINNDGSRNLQTLALPVIVEPPLWQTDAAYAAYAFLIACFAALVYAAFRRRALISLQIAAANDRLRAEISERQAKELALEMERATTQRYLDVVEVIMIALDRQGRITMINAKGLQVLATNEQAALGADLVQTFVPPHEHAEVRRQLSAPEKYRYCEWRLQPRSGAQRLIAWQSIRLPEGDGGGLLISGTDVTQVRDLERQLRDAQKMEALGTLARGVAHDFNNILSAILGYTELSRADIDPQNPAQEHLKHISASVTRARDLIQRILTFGRVAALHPRTVSVADAIADAIQLVRPVLPREVHLSTRLEPQCGMILADPSQLVQIVLNLCTNAAQSMSARGGTLEVFLSRCHVDEETARRLTLARAGSYARLRVVDTGPGMDAYTLSRIFEPFFTTREQGEGTGLGLAVVHGIVGSLNGSIDVRSTVGEGTRFDVYFPHLADAQYTQISGITVSTEAPEGIETVLFVDDEKAIATIAARGLGALGYQVITAHDAAQALEKFASAQDAIDIVVTDQTMPGIHGEELARILKEQAPNLPVVLISGADHPSGPHIDGFVAKPFTTEQLAHSIRQALNARRVSGPQRTDRQANDLNM